MTRPGTLIGYQIGFACEYTSKGDPAGSHELPPRTIVRKIEYPK